MKFKNQLLLLTICLLSIVFFSQCNKANEIVDDFFIGVFSHPDGWEIEVEKAGGAYDGVITKKGTTPYWEYAEVGDKILIGGSKKSDGKVRGWIMNGDDSFLDPGVVSATSNQLTFEPKTGAPYVFTRLASNGSGTGNGGGSGGSVRDTILRQQISGNTYDRKTITFQVPANAKSLTVITYEETTADFNTADLFLKYGSAPQIYHNPPANYSYTWSADKASTNSNRANEICTVTSPSAGTWYAVLYGYNNYFYSRVLVYIEK